MVNLKHKNLYQLQLLRQDPHYANQWDDIDIAIEKLEKKERDMERRPPADDDIDVEGDEV